MAWLFVHVLLAGFRNRIAVLLLQGLWAYFFNKVLASSHGIQSETSMPARRIQ
jgi:hypothetical protein